MTEQHTRDGLRVEVTDAREAGRFEARVDGALGAYAEYHRRGDHLVFTHTVTEPDWGGRGLASALAAGAMEQVRAAGERVVPRCPFIADWLHRHPEATDLVDEADRALIRPADR